MRDELHFDAIVIGAGSAGLVAGTRLAQRGARVCLLAKGIGSTHLAPGTIDVLGYNPDRVEEPGRAVEELISARPGPKLKKTLRGRNLRNSLMPPAGQVYGEAPGASQGTSMEVD